MERMKIPNLRNASKGGFEPELNWLRVRHSTAELPRSTISLFVIVTCLVVRGCHIISQSAIKSAVFIHFQPPPTPKHWCMTCENIWRRLYFASRRTVSIIVSHRRRHCRVAISLLSAVAAGLPPTRNCTLCTLWLSKLMRQPIASSICVSMQLFWKM